MNAEFQKSYKCYTCYKSDLLNTLDTILSYDIIVLNTSSSYLTIIKT